MAQENLNNLGEDLQKKPEGGQEEIKNETKENLVKDLNESDYSQLVWEMYSKLVSGFKWSHNIEQESLSNGYVKICINDKLLTEKRGEPEMSVTIKKSGEINFRVNPYSHYEEYYFIAENLTPFEFINEMKKIKEYFKIGVPAKNSLLKKIEFPKEDDFDLSDYMNDDQIPGDLTQENYEQVEKTEGVEAAVKYADVNKDKKNS